MEPGVSVTFDDVAVYFSEEEWQSLEEWQRQLYKDIMMDNYRTLCSLGLITVKPEIIVKIMAGEDPCVNQVQDRPSRDIKERPTSDVGARPAQIKANRMGEVEVPMRPKRKPKLPLVIYSPSTRQKRKAVDSRVTAKNCRQRNIKENMLEKNHNLDEAIIPSSYQPGSAEKLYICTVCGKTFDLWPSLLKHFNAHEGTKMFSCLDCGKSFSYRSQLVLHQTIHSGLKPYRCSVCGKHFLRRYSLDVHMRSHTGDRPHVCSVCHKSFSELSKLHRHVRIHTGDLPFQCGTCGKRFNDSYILNRHLKVHIPLEDVRCDKGPTDCDPHHETQKDHLFRCLECGKAFNNQSRLDEHKRTHTNEMSPPQIYQLAGHPGDHTTGGSNSGSSLYREVVLFNLDLITGKKINPATHRNGSRERESGLHAPQRIISPKLHEPHNLRRVQTSNRLIQPYVEDTRIKDEMDMDTEHGENREQIDLTRVINTSTECVVTMKSECDTHQIPPTINTLNVKAERDVNMSENAERATHQITPIINTLNVKTERDVNMSENAERATHQITPTINTLNVKAECDVNMSENAERATHQITPIINTLNVKTERDVNMSENAERATHQITPTINTLNVKAERDVNMSENAERATHQITPTINTLNVKAERDVNMSENAERATHQITPTINTLNVKAERDVNMSENAERATHQITPTLNTLNVKNERDVNMSKNAERATHQITPIINTLNVKAERDVNMSENAERATHQITPIINTLNVKAERDVNMSENAERATHQITPTINTLNVKAECDSHVSENSDALNRHLKVHVPLKYVRYDKDPTGCDRDGETQEDHLFRCLACGKAFNNQSRLAEHKTTHTNEMSLNRGVRVHQLSGHRWGHTTGGSNSGSSLYREVVLFNLDLITGKKINPPIHRNGSRERESGLHAPQRIISPKLHEPHNLGSVQTSSKLDTKCGKNLLELVSPQTHLSVYKWNTGTECGGNREQMGPPRVINTKTERVVTMKSKSDTRQITPTINTLNVKTECDVHVSENAECDIVLESSKCDTRQSASDSEDLDTRSEPEVGTRDVTQQLICPIQEVTPVTVILLSDTEEENRASHRCVKVGGSPGVNPRATHTAEELCPEGDSNLLQDTDQGTPLIVPQSLPSPTEKELGQVELENKVRGQHDPKENLRVCNECGKGFRYRSRLIVHQRTHTGEKPFTCDCGKGFQQRYQMVLHQKSHKADKPYNCPDCGKGFLHKCRFLLHQRIHAGDWPHTCTVCGKGFRERGKLSRHHRTHAEEKPYKCMDCGKGFTKTCDLNRHSKIHGEKPFKCPECGKGFTDASGFRRHCRTHGLQVERGNSR